MVISTPVTHQPGLGYSTLRRTLSAVRCWRCVVLPSVSRRELLYRLRVCITQRAMARPGFAYSTTAVLPSSSLAVSSIFEKSRTLISMRITAMACFMVSRTTRTSSLPISTKTGAICTPDPVTRGETGKGAAIGTKLNVPLPPHSDDGDFFSAWEAVEAHIAAANPELIMLQCGADSLAGDPITHLAFTEEAHAHAATRLRILAERCCEGRLLALGGGGYDRANLGRAWTRVCEALT